MRASRLLRILIILQNRGRQSSKQLADELDVTRRTILRDVDSMGEAGLPIVVHQGPRGGIELGFNYRSRLTGLTRDEAEAIGVLLGQSLDFLSGFGLLSAGKRAADKLMESFPDKIRDVAVKSAEQFSYDNHAIDEIDPRVPAVAKAIREEKRVTLQARQSKPISLEPKRLVFERATWFIQTAQNDVLNEWPLSEWGDINISRKVN